MAVIANGARGTSSRKRKAIAEESSSDTDEVEFCSSSEDDDDIVAELSSSSESGDDDDNDSDGGGDFDSCRQWCRVDADNPPPCPPRFQFLPSPGKTFHVEDPGDPLQYFEVLLDDQLIDLMVTETNRYAAQFLSCNRLKPHSRFASWVPVTTGEMRVFLSLLLLQGVIQKPEQTMYWSQNNLVSTPVFGDTMSRNRFFLIMKMLHFVDNETPVDPENHPQPKLWKIWPFLSSLLQNFQTSYVLERDISIDESLMLYKGRLSWRQYLPLKRARFGVKLFVLCEAESAYIWNLIVYTGKGTNIATRHERDTHLPMGTKVVLKLMEPLEGKGHCLTTDNFYTSPELVEILIEQKTDIYGTARATRKDMPAPFKKAKLKKGEVQAFQRGKCTAIQWKDKRLITLLSTVHSADMVQFQDSKGRTVEKPSVVCDYNHTMGGVDLSDQMLATYPVARKRQKIYYKKLFRQFLDDTALNAFILYKKDGGKMSNLKFRLSLIERLITKYRDNSQVRRLGRPPTSETERLTGRHFPSYLPPTEKKQEPTRRCTMCSQTEETGRKVRKETRTWCDICKKALCVIPCFKQYHTARNLK